MKNQKGITLIALVITIIVLLILAGVSIAMLTGDNGILNQANRAKTSTTQGEVADKINMTLNAELANLLIDGKFSGETDSFNEETIKSAIASENGITTADFDITVNAHSDINAATDVLIIAPSATGAYKDYTTLTGKITATKGTDDEIKYTVEKVEVKTTAADTTVPSNPED